MSGEQPLTSSQASVEGWQRGRKRREKTWRGGKESKAPSNFPTDAWQLNTLLSIMTILRTPCDKYIGVIVLEEAEVMKTHWRAADRGKCWEGSQHLRHWKAGGSPSDVYGEPGTILLMGLFVTLN